MARIAFQGIAKRFGDVSVIEQLDLEIHDQEFMVFVGPSGCGKSTALRMIAGLEEPSEGTLVIGDRVVNDVHPKDRDVAMVFQSYALYPHMTVRENIAFGLRIRKMPDAEIDKLVDEAAGILGLKPLLDRKPKALSGGQRQRVALGRAIVRDPDVFLFDEPLSNLDAKMRVQMRAEIARLHHRLGATMIYVTHDQTEAMTLGQRIVVMKDGLVQQVAAPLELYERPANRFVAGFIGSPAMNFLSGRLERTDGLRFVTDAGEAVGLPAAFAPGAALVGRPAILRIRPEHLDLAPAGAAAGLSALVQVVESLGSETMVHLGLRTGTFVVRCPGQAAAVMDQPLGVNLRAEGIRLFAADDQGRALPIG